MTLAWLRRFSIILGLWMLLPAAEAGVFNLPHYLFPKEFSLGVEPQIDLSGQQSGISLNVRATYGLTDYMNVGGYIGTGSGPKQLRIAALTTFDIFPDFEKQPGIGLGAEFLYFRAGDTNNFLLSGIPYIHKTFRVSETEFEPFLAIPMGIHLGTSVNNFSMNVAIGSIFKWTDTIRYIFELGVSVVNSNSYVSGGLAFYF